MADIKFERQAPRRYFTFYGLTPNAVLQLREFSRMERDIAELPGLTSLVARKLCTPTGKFRIDRLEAQSLVTAAYQEGWHEKY